MAAMFALANPKRFMDLSARLLPWLAILTVFALGAGLVLGFLAPPEAYDALKLMGFNLVSLANSVILPAAIGVRVNTVTACLAKSSGEKKFASKPFSPC